MKNGFTGSISQKYCSVCGKELIELPAQTFTNGFDVYTGEPAVFVTNAKQCPDYVLYVITCFGEEPRVAHDKHEATYRIN